MHLKSSSNAIPSKSIDEVLIQLDDIIDQSIRENSYLCTFAYVYRRTTFEIKHAIENGRFENAGRMVRLDVIFANLFIDAYYNYQQSKKTTKSWEFTFRSSGEKLAIVQHILLGMNTHINFDLSVAAAAVSDGSEIIYLKNDFMVINQILADLTDKMQQSLNNVSFAMKLLDIFMFRNDEKIINFSIRKARDFAWLNAMELALLNKESRESRTIEIDKRVVQLSEMIKKPPGKVLRFILKVISILENNDKRKIIEKMRLE